MLTARKQSTSPGEITQHKVKSDNPADLLLESLNYKLLHVKWFIQSVYNKGSASPSVFFFITSAPLHRNVHFYSLFVVL